MKLTFFAVSLLWHLCSLYASVRRGGDEWVQLIPALCNDFVRLMAILRGSVPKRRRRARYQRRT
jgi:hypothetical protein